jgi:hypothetical protein
VLLHSSQHPSSPCDRTSHSRLRSSLYLTSSTSSEALLAVVDPDLIELRTGLLVAAFGLSVPQKACWPNCQHPWNGNYLAVSQDHGHSWPNVIRMTSGVLTTHYMGIRAVDEMPGMMQLRRELADCYEGLGYFYVSSPSKDWGQARVWYGKALAVWRDGTRYGVSSPYKVPREQEAARMLAACDANLAEK